MLLLSIANVHFVLLFDSYMYSTEQDNTYVFTTMIPWKLRCYKKKMVYKLNAEKKRKKEGEREPNKQTIIIHSHVLTHLIEIFRIQNTIYLDICLNIYIFKHVSPSLNPF